MNSIRKAYALYADGLRSMVLGRTLWKIILLKLIIMFAVLKLFFFPRYLEANFDTDSQRSEHVITTITAAASHR